MTSRRRAIGVLAPQLSGDYFGTLLTGIHALTRQYDPRLIAIQAAPQDVARSRLAIDQIDGWIVVNNADGLDLLARAGVPIVTIGVQAPGQACPAVFPDNVSGMRAAVSHLIDHGHQRIGFVGDLAHNDIKQRYQGYQAALAERGLAFDPALVFAVGDTSEQSAAAATQRLLANQGSCSAVVGATDETALGILSAVQAAGLRVPADIAVVGFDDIILAHSAAPPLTTIRLPIRALGRTAAELLLAQIDGQAVPNEATYVPTALIPRHSCGCNITIPAPATSERPTDGGWQAVLGRQLAELARYPLPDDPAIPLSAIWPGGQTLIDAVTATIEKTEEISTAALYAAWQQLVELTENLEVLLAILTLIEQAGARQLAAATADPEATARLQRLFVRARLEMVRARLAPETGVLRVYSSLVQQNYEISKTLLAAGIGEAQQLAWLCQTPLSWACLGLWDGSDGGQAGLAVAGSYSCDRQSGQVVPRGQRYAGGRFPPNDLLPAAVREQGAEIAIVLPIKTQSRDWGVLALAGSIQYLRSSGNYDALSAIATLLGAAMERDALQQTLHDAYDRERGLANIVRELGSPVIPLLPQVLLIPLVGAIDSARAQQIIEAVLEGVASHQATTVLLDISGVPIVDTQVANSLVQAARASRLLGARVILIGVRPEIAQSIVGLGIELQHLATEPTLAAAVQSLLRRQEHRQ